MTLLALALASSFCAAQGEVKTGHWERKPAALLFFDANGDLAAEHHLGASEERRAWGGVSSDKRLSWLFEKTGKTRRLRLFGSDGKTLWDTPDADAPLAGGDPLLFSVDGETLLVSERLASGWRLRARDYIGTPIMEAGPFAELQQTALTSDGRFALARWTVPDQSATHTFLDLKKKTRKDVPSSAFELGQAKLLDDGKVVSGGRVALDLSHPVEEKK